MSSHLDNKLKARDSLTKWQRPSQAFLDLHHLILTKNPPTSRRQSFILVNKEVIDQADSHRGHTGPQCWRGKEEAPPKKHYELFPENFRTWVFGGTPKYADLKNHQEGTENGKKEEGCGGRAGRSEKRGKQQGWRAQGCGESPWRPSRSAEATPGTCRSSQEDPAGFCPLHWPLPWPPQAMPSVHTE